MAKIVPGQIPTRDLHQFLLGSVAPRPIAFISTVDENGRQNLAPYSFFNAFSSNPPIVVFSSNRRVSDNTTKDTLHNVKVTEECVINVVNYDIVRKMAVTSVSFDSNISEFEKAGLTPIGADHVQAKRVKESPVNMECRVKDIITLGAHGGAGHLVICEVLCMHINDEIIEDGRINPHKIDLMGRMGRAYYVRASGEAVMTIVQPVEKMVIGYNALSDFIKSSDLLTANEVGMLAGNFEMPSEANLTEAQQSLEKNGIGPDSEQMVQYAKDLLKQDRRLEALAVLTLCDR